MNYESIILELLSRVQILEQKVGVLEQSKPERNDLDEEFDEQDEENRITRSVARQHVMDKIKKQYSFLDVQKGNRATRADIIMKTNNSQNKETEITAKFYYSKSYSEFPSGWHTVKKSDLENNNIDLHIFTVSYENRYYSVLFSQEHLRQFVQTKSLNTAGVYYFYFNLSDEEKMVERRDGDRDVSQNYEDWDLIAQILKTKTQEK